MAAQVLDLLAEGRSVASIAHDLDSSDQKIYTWRRQERLDRGEQPGLTTAEKAELAAAKKRIAELETELVVAQQAVDALQTSPSKRCSLEHIRDAVRHLLARCEASGEGVGEAVGEALRRPRLVGPGWSG